MDFVIILMLIVTLGIARFLTVFFHELGHALPAIKYTGMPVTIYIGSFGDERNCVSGRHGMLEIYINKNPLTWYRGLCVYDDGHMTLEQSIIQVLAGPLFSLIVAAVAMTVAILFDMHGVFRFIFGMFLIFSVADLFYNLYPRTMILPDYRIIRTDGRVLIDLMKDWFEEQQMRRRRR